VDCRLYSVLFTLINSQYTKVGTREIRQNIRAPFKAATSNAHISTTNHPNVMILYVLQLSQLVLLCPDILTRKNKYCYFNFLRAGRYYLDSAAMNIEILDSELGQ
jgi:hypothetical protein